jgi:hypothetical protein
VSRHTAAAGWRQPRRLLLVGLALSVLVVPSSPVRADTGTVTVTATTQSTFSLSLDTNAVAFGTNLAPDATASNGTNVAAYADATNGAYYVRNGNASGFAVVATVKSTAPWSGSVAAAENTGTAGITIAGGGLRWSLGDMSNLAGAQAGTTFSTAADATVWDSASSCASGATRQAGVCSYNFDFSLRVRWTDAPGSFSSVVTYSASQ